MGRNTLLSAGSTLLAAVALVVGVVGVATPYWATFTSFHGNEQGHFGPWTLCRERDSLYQCDTSRLRPSGYTTAAGVSGLIAVILTVLMCVMSPVVLAMRVTRRQMFVKFRHAILAKLTISCISVTCCMLALILFGIDLDGRRLGEDIGYTVTRGWSYYLLVIYTLLSLILSGFAAAEFVLARRLGGDPVKMSRDPTGSLAPVIVNPTATTKQPPPPGAIANRYPPVSHSANGYGVTILDNNSSPPAVIYQPSHMTSPMTSLSGVRSPNGQRNATSPITFAQLDVSTVASNIDGVYSNSANVTSTRSVTPQNGTPLAYDPRRVPGRSSLRKPGKSRAISYDCGTGSESVDSGVVIIPNPQASVVDSGHGDPLAMAASGTLSGGVRSKKVRIQTLDTPV